MGAKAYGRDNHRLAPVCFSPDAILSGIDYTLPVASAQVKSAIILAGLYAKGETIVREPLPSRDHTERMLTAMGASLQQEADGAIRVQGQQLEGLQPLHWQVPGDPSSAAFMAVMATLCPNSEVLLKHVGLNPHRTGLFEALKRIGADITVEQERLVGGEPVGDVRIRSAELKGDLTLEAEDIPALVDEIPILAVACVYLQGTLTVRGADELRKKESDRLLAMQTELAKVGVAVTLFEDGLVLEGNPDACLLTTPTHPIQTWHDHRIAMAMASLNLIHNARQPQKATQWVLDDTEVVAVSFPTFFADIHRLVESSS
jgi:3-phosphoshikimate 1-carboxyvinyltransferase